MGKEMSLEPKLCLHGGGVMWVESNCPYCNAFKLAFFLPIVCWNFPLEISSQISWPRGWTPQLPQRYFCLRTDLKLLH